MKKKIVILSLAALLVMAALIIFLVATAGTTVSLMTRHRIVLQDGYGITTQLEYGEKGRLESYSVTTKGYDGTREKTSITYTYENGRIGEAEIKWDGGKLTLDYGYSSKGILEEIRGKGKGYTVEAECDSDGLIEEITCTCEGEEMVLIYDYDRDDRLEEMELLRDGVRREKRSYENGYMVEQTLYDYRGDWAYLMEYEYDEMGRQTYFHSRASSGSESEQTMTYDEYGRLIEIVDVKDGEELSYDAEWDGNTVILEREDGNLTYERVYNEQNQETKAELREPGRLLQKFTWDYAEMKVPRDYQKPNNQDPIWMLEVLTWISDKN